MSFNEWPLIRGAFSWEWSLYWHTKPLYYRQQLDHPHRAAYTMQSCDGQRLDRGWRPWLSRGGLGSNCNAYNNQPTDQGPRVGKKRAGANGPGNPKSSTELHPDSWRDCAVSKVDLLGMWWILFHGAVRTFQPEDIWEGWGERNNIWQYKI